MVSTEQAKKLHARWINCRLRFAANSDVCMRTHITETKLIADARDAQTASRHINERRHGHRHQYRHGQGHGHGHQLALGRGRGFWIAALLSLSLISPASARGLAGDLPDFAELVRQNKAAVVNISIDDARTTTSRMPNSNNDDGSDGDSTAPGDSDQPGDDDYQKFLEEFQDELPSFPSESLGSGFILTEDGFILTCAHVVEDASRVIVRFSDRREYEAKIIGKDKRSDVAVLKVEAQGLPVVSIGEPSELEVGEWVLAIGSPFGFDSSATSGIVSAKGRSLPNESYVPFIQTDVAINPGNSGGPLFDLDGKVVGINAQIYSRTGGFMGLSFAVPIDLAIRVADQLRENGEVKRGWLGVAIQEVTADLADSLGMETPSGALISEIIADGPAAQSELETGDVIVAFNGALIGKMSDLPPVVGSTLAGSSAELDVVRNGEQIVLDVMLGELRAESAVADAQSEEEPSDSPIENSTESDAPVDSEELADLGLSVEIPTQEERTSLNLTEGGLIVRSLSSGSGMRAGVKEGDIILRLATTDLNDPAQFTDLVAELAGAPEGADSTEGHRSVPLLIRRGARSLFLALKLH